jgi:hypothetical protein
VHLRDKHNIVSPDDADISKKVNTAVDRYVFIKFFFKYCRIVNF